MKKFKDSKIGQVLLGAASILNPTLGSVLKGVTSPQEAIAEITKADAPQEDKIKLQQLIYTTPIQEVLRFYLTKNQTYYLLSILML